MGVGNCTLIFMNKQITQEKLLLAIAMSEFHQTTHVMFIPPKTEYLHMLRLVKNKKLVDNIGEKFYKLTKKGWRKLNARSSQLIKDERYKKAYEEIDTFVNSL